MMKEQKKIPTGKIQRASKVVRTGVKVSGNYIKHFSKGLFSEQNRDDLDKENAEDIFEALSELKGGALKIAQMLSMNDALPQAFTDKFSLAQYSAPPLSFPLIVKTFIQELGKNPNEIFDKFTQNAVNAASIGQVHHAELNGKKFAVKIQYPGVADSLKTDIKMVKPFALQLMNITKAELNHYAEEVELMLEMETDYLGELERSIEISNACKHIENIVFPKYYREYSSKRIITMDKIEGLILDDFIKNNPNQELRNKIGQAIWDFYNYQMHTLRKFHADPHSGNFFVTPEEKCAIIDFGAVKEIPDSLYKSYFKIVLLDPVKDKEEYEQIFVEMNMITAKDSPEEKLFFMKIFSELIEIVNQPFKVDFFDFGSSNILEKMFELSNKYAKDKTLRKANSARGVRDAIYLNKTYFGMYSILSRLHAKVQTNRGKGFVFESE